ncbi:hypothetical protein TIFTF001_021555 [Ficus carica]|uniref:Phytosulfokine n=1 Tax=Ficus carica TaxID=3494 RepID=A0AA88ASQ3_FICCA|nr:hypothetical protein TIFTF001_021555 [Ficus carica]
MMSSKVNAILCMVSLILFFSITCRARPGLAFSNVDFDPAKLGNAGVEETAEKVMEEESCEGVGEDECLMRRTLAAHTDYIYTQKQKP